MPVTKIGTFYWKVPVDFLEGDNFQFGAATQKLFLPSWAARAGQWGHPVTKISNFKFCLRPSLDRASGERYNTFLWI